MRPTPAGDFPYQAATSTSVPVAGGSAAAAVMDEDRPLDRFACRLRFWRQARGLSQAALARAALVHRDLIAKIERGRRWPSHDLVMRCELTLATGGELIGLWPQVENDRAGRQLLAAEQRLAERLRQAHHQGIPVQRRPHTAAPAAEAAFLGDQSVTIVTPLRREAITARPVVALEDVVGAQRLGELAWQLGLMPIFENMPASDEIDLNRPNLLVLCGPRYSKRIGQVLASDPHLRFARTSGQPWTLHDRHTSRTYRSGQDQQPPRPWDVAYLGRLPRPDGAGSVMILAGLHPQGSLGAIRLLVEHIGELHAQVQDGCFSVLIETDYHPETGEPDRVGPLTPFYWQNPSNG